MRRDICERLGSAVRQAELATKRQRDEPGPAIPGKKLKESTPDHVMTELLMQTPASVSLS